MSRDRVGTLDGVRGVAILLVLAGHTATNYQPLNDNLRRWLEAIANSGAGVRLFFVLSGYLITHLLLQELAATGTLSIRRFYWRRALRIYPAFYAYLLALTLLQFWRPVGLTWETGAAAASFTWNYALLWMKIPPEGYWDLGHLWTLALEQQFYLVWPLVLWVCGVRRALWVALALIIWCPLARVGTYFQFPAQRGLVGMMLHTGVDSLMVGCAAALLLQFPSVMARLRTQGPTVAWVAVLWLLVLSPLTASPWAEAAGWRGFPVACGFTLDALAAAWLTAWVHLMPSPGVQKLFGRGWLPALGIISYSLYLWQQLFLSPTGWLADGKIALPLLGAVVVALLSYCLIEKPALRWKLRLAQPIAPLAQS